MRLCFRFDWLLFVLEELQKWLLTNFPYISVRCRSGNKKLMIIYLSFFVSTFRNMFSLPALFRWNSLLVLAFSHYSQLWSSTDEWKLLLMFNIKTKWRFLLTDEHLIASLHIGVGVGHLF